MPKLWIGNRMHSVEAEVQEYCEKLEERIKELEEVINYATDGIDALSPYLSKRAVKDMLAIKQTLEKAHKG